MKTVSKLFALLLLLTSLQLQPAAPSFDRENEETELRKPEDPIIRAAAYVKKAGSRVERAGWTCLVAGLIHDVFTLSDVPSTLTYLSLPLVITGWGTSITASGITDLRLESLSRDPSILSSGFNLALAVIGAKLAHFGAQHIKDTIHIIVANTYYRS
jgi:hypothetical protein